MTTQRKSRIVKLLENSKSSLLEKLQEIPFKTKIRVVSMYVKLGKYDCVVVYNLKKEAFTRIEVIEETIEL